MRDLAVKAGVPLPSIVLDELAETTEQNANNTQAIFDKDEIKTVILVTSAYHQRRAYLEFTKSTNAAQRDYEIKILNHPVPSDKDWSAFWWLTPGGWWLALSELVKVIVFHLAGIF